MYTHTSWWILSYTSLQYRKKNQNLIGFEIKQVEEFIFNWIISLYGNWKHKKKVEIKKSFDERNQLIGWSACVERYLIWILNDDDYEIYTHHLIWLCKILQKNQ